MNRRSCPVPVVADPAGSEKLAEGFEPTTCGLQNRCSTTELRERAFIHLLWREAIVTNRR